MYLWAAISIGLLGSVHCAGMCGPVLLALNRGNKPFHTALHHTGRLLTYMFFGAVAGAIGESFSFLGFQQPFSIVIGTVMVLGVIVLPFRRSLRQVERSISGWALKFSSWIHRQGFSTSMLRFLGGIGNGLLPCGLVYLGVAGAATTFTPWDGALFMLGFGVGTLPVLVSVMWLGEKLGLAFRNRVRRLIPITVFVMGCLLIVRGLNLGIPMLSPTRPASTEEVVTCH